MVRLRRKGLHYLQVRILFQFHMVRLRLCCFPGLSHHIEISIPHGTIKTLMPRRQPRLVAISIPHGTIKTYQQVAILSTLQKFQFHMVRLRLPANVTYVYVKCISIPHGTIKTV